MLYEQNSACNDFHGQKDVFHVSRQNHQDTLLFMKKEKINTRSFTSKNQYTTTFIKKKKTNIQQDLRRKKDLK